MAPLLQSTDLWSHGLDVEHGLFFDDSFRGIYGLLEHQAPREHQFYYEREDVVRKEILSVFDEYDPAKHKRVIITGHSLGNGKGQHKGRGRD